MHRQWIFLSLFMLLVVALFPQPAMAYIGPGAGLSAIGAFFAIVAGVIVALFGFLWYPIKRLRRKWKKTSCDKCNEKGVVTP